MSRAARSRRWIIIFAWGVFALFPVYWMAITAFKEGKDIYDGPFLLPFVDFQPSLQAWEFILDEGREQFLTGLVNSTIFSLLGAFFAVLIGAFAAYGLARYQYKYGPARNNDISFFIVSQRMMPPIVAVIALFAIFRFLGMLDTHLGMILVYTWFSLPLTGLSPDRVHRTETQWRSSRQLRSTATERSNKSSVSSCRWRVPDSQPRTFSRSSSSGTTSCWR